KTTSINFNPSPKPLDMRTLHRVTLTLATPLGTPLAGDTLFGQLCWALREAKGEAELTRQLDGYTQGQPWLVVSDGFPANHLPKPSVPQHFEPQRDPALRKAAKKNRWIPCTHSGKPLASLLASAKSDAEAYGAAPHHAIQAHNTLNRLTGTTGKDEFAPYTQPQLVHAAGQRIDLYLHVDKDRIAPAEVGCLLGAIGTIGFGRDASTGLGKFRVERCEPMHWVASADANAYWTLAPCAPQGQGFDGEKSYWRMLTRFGRHGNAHALAGQPFKTPVLLAATAAVFVPSAGYTPRSFIGQGLGDHGRLSKTEAATVQQGYAPVVPIRMETLAL
ncbi:MAG TPA: hypothetical protein VJ001_10385, partial [Rhodocyclaceae bacterium]|nr:hypothetical protein [Rhodocyclaceae bacterium]